MAAAAKRVRVRLGAPTKRARKVRVATEFEMRRLAAALAPPISGSSVYAWSLQDIFDARNLQMLGHFAQPARLAAAMRTDDALAVARSNRLAPQRCIQVEIVPAPKARGRAIAGEAEALFGQGGIAASPGTLADINGCLVDHGVAFGLCSWTVREDGSRTDLTISFWPIEYVRWDLRLRCYMARVDLTVGMPALTRDETDAGSYGGFYGVGSGEVPIVHGDGRWIIFSTHDFEPHKQEAAILPGAVVWARHAFAIRDWSKSSVAHGSAKVIGEMPMGVALQNAEGLTPDALAMAELLRHIASSDAPIGIRPAGSKTDFLTNTSTAWQIFAELVSNAEKAAARIYLGTDGTLGSQGGAPGVDVQAMFGVATTKVQGDLAAISRGMQTGAIEPWCAINFGDSSLAPKRKYLLPDADEDGLRESDAARAKAFYDEFDRVRASGVLVDQTVVDALARKYRIAPPPTLKPGAALPSATGAAA